MTTLDHEITELTEVGFGRWQSYPEYKDSGIDWLGEIPSHWEFSRLKFLIKLNPPKSESSHLPDDTEVSFLPMENIGENGELCLDQTKRIRNVRQGYTYFRNEDVILAKITPCFENGKGAIVRNLCNGVGFGTTELFVLRSFQNSIPEFIYYVTKSNDFRLLGIATMQGVAGQKRLREDYLANFLLVIPTIPEQHAIASFLDRETNKIDTLIAKKRKLIALLQEQRSAIITHAVTKGLDPNVPMKDSGIKWLGHIPVHWEVKRLKHISPRLSVGLVINPSTYVDPEGTVPFIFGSNISEGNISIENARRITTTSNHALHQSILRAGDLVTIRVGYPGVTAVVPSELDGINCASVMITRRSTRFVSDWLCYLMNSKVGNTNVEMVEYGAAQKQFNLAHAVNFWFPVPPKPEQEKIVSYLSRETAKIDKLISKTEETINRLQEYRSSLISAAVTGKIDVRDEMSIIE